MLYLYVFLGVIIALCKIYEFVNFDKRNQLMKRKHPHYSGSISSSSDYYRLTYTYFTSKNLNKEEKKFLRNHQIVYSIQLLIFLFIIIKMFILIINR